MAAANWGNLKPEEAEYVLWDSEWRSASSNEGVAQRVLVHFDTSTYQPGQASFNPGS